MNTKAYYCIVAGKIIGYCVGYDKPSALADGRARYGQCDDVRFYRFNVPSGLAQVHHWRKES